MLPKSWQTYCASIGSPVWDVQYTVEIPDISISGRRVARELTTLVSQPKPSTSSEFVDDTDDVILPEIRSRLYLDHLQHDLTGIR